MRKIASNIDMLNSDIHDLNYRFDAVVEDEITCGLSNSYTKTMIKQRLEILNEELRYQKKLLDTALRAKNVCKV